MTKYINLKPFQFNCYFSCVNRMGTNHKENAIGRASGHYSSLFSLPSQKSIIVFLLMQHLLICIIIKVTFSLYGILDGILIGTSLFIINLFIDYIITKTLMQEDPIFNFKRCSFLSFISSLILLLTALFAILGFIKLESTVYWFNLSNLGLYLAFLLRFFVFQTVSVKKTWKSFLSASVQPLSLFIFLSFFAGSGQVLGSINFLHIFLSILFATFAVQLYIFVINRKGIDAVNINSLTLFRAYLSNWTEDYNKPLENILEKLGECKDTIVNLFTFKTNKGFKAILVIPIIHPGPFKNVGSSNLPSYIQKSLKKRFGCVVSVPHGVSGHELDLASTIQNKKVLKSLLDMEKDDFPNQKATPFIRISESNYSASCQLFGRHALLTLTTAPETMEDLTQDLNYEISAEAEKMGLYSATVIDSHNSIDGPFSLRSVHSSLSKVAVRALEASINQKHYPFEIGTKNLILKRFRKRDGIGDGGISIIVVKVDQIKSAYVTIDGNNMVPGLREKILAKLKDIGITEGEILTTDSHSVNGVTNVARGYHPVGEVIDHDFLIKKIEYLASEAQKNLEPVYSSFISKTIPDIKIIGEKQLNTLSNLVHNVVIYAKKTALIVFPPISLMLTVLYLII